MIRTVHVGLGSRGTDWAVGVLPEAPELEVVAFVDRDPLRRKEFDALTGATSSAAVDYSADGDADFDAVLITASTGAHGPLARAALEAGKHVLLESPFTVDLVEAHSLVALAEDRGLVLVVAQNHRFFPAALVAKEALRSVGRIRNARVSFRRDHEYPAQTPSPDSSVLHRFAGHHFDLMRFLLDDEVAAVTARPWHRGQSPDALLSSFSATVELAGGALVEYSASSTSQAAVTPWSGEWLIEGDTGVVEWSGETLVNLSHVTVHRAGLPPETVPIADPVADRVAVVRDFADAVRSGLASGIAGRANLGTVAATLAAWESVRSGRRVEVRSPEEAETGR